MNKQLKIVLLAITGFGNPVFNALLSDNRVNLEAVFTEKYDQPFPYYHERQLNVLCQEKGVSCYDDIKLNSEKGTKLLNNLSPDLIIVATFKQILNKSVINLPPLGVVNLHPSLLPKYRGPSPTNAALMNDEKETGVSVHYITEKIDEGNILIQKSICIDKQENDGQLRRKLAILSGKLIPEIIGLFSDFSKPVGIPQDHSMASSAPKPSLEDGFLENTTDINIIKNKIRALNPLPGTSILINNHRIPVDDFELFQDSRLDGLFENQKSIDLIINSQGIRLSKKITSK